MWMIDLFPAQPRAAPAASRQMPSYTKPELLARPGDSLSLGLDNETKKTQNLF
jgi:hypothetical protein